MFSNEEDENEALKINIDESTHNNLELYPNLTDGSFVISFPNMELEENLEVQIIDLTGRTIRKQVAKFKPRLNINEKLAPGIYMINIRSNTLSKSQKLIVK